MFMLVEVLETPEMLLIICPSDTFIHFNIWHMITHKTAMALEKWPSLAVDLKNNVSCEMIFRSPSLPQLLS